jgi:glutamate--cysteine ligase catalytic subunit
MFSSRQQGQQLLGKDEYVLSTSNFPRYDGFFLSLEIGLIICFYFFRNGCPNFTYPVHKPTPGASASASLFFPDEVIYPDHPRFK